MYDELVKDLRENHDKYFARDMEAADAIEELSRAQEQWIEHERNALLKSIPRWVPVTERLPEPGIDVLVKQTFSYPYVTLGWRTATYWAWVKYPSDHKSKNPTSFSSICPGNKFVTHWMPLPEPPKEETC